MSPQKLGFWEVPIFSTLYISEVGLKGVLRMGLPHLIWISLFIFPIFLFLVHMILSTKYHTHSSSKGIKSNIGQNLFKVIIYNNSCIYNLHMSLFPEPLQDISISFNY